jgi:lipopolysaccharide transport system ATP-binding protein
LLKGSYTVGVYLLCERGLHTYDSANPVATLEVSQSGLERGVVALPHRWQSPAQSEHGSGQ